MVLLLLPFARIAQEAHYVPARQIALARL